MLMKRTFSNVSTYNPPAIKKKRTSGQYPRRKGSRYGFGFQPTSSSQIGPELKWWDHGQDLTALDTAPDANNPASYHIESLNQMAAGDDGNQRQGLKIQIKKLNLRMKVKVDPNSDGTNANIVADAHLFRVIVYLDVSPNGAGATWDQIFEVNPTSEGQEYVYNKLSSTGRFKILIDKWIRVPPSFVVYDGTNFHAYGNHMFFKKSIPLDVATHFSDTTNNLTAIQRNNIGMFIVADASATTYTDMKFSFRSRIRFHDY